MQSSMLYRIHPEKSFDALHYRGTDIFIYSATRSIVELSSLELQSNQELCVVGTLSGCLIGNEPTQGCRVLLQFRLISTVTDEVRTNKTSIIFQQVDVTAVLFLSPQHDILVTWTWSFASRKLCLNEDIFKFMSRLMVLKKPHPKHFHMAHNTSTPFQLHIVRTKHSRRIDPNHTRERTQ